MKDDCLFCDGFMCDICVHREAGNDRVSLGVYDDGMLSSYLAGIELSAEAERMEPEFDPW